MDSAKAPKYYKGTFSHPSLGGYDLELSLTLRTPTAGFWSTLGQTEEVTFTSETVHGEGTSFVISEKGGVTQLKGTMDAVGILRGEVFQRGVGGGRFVLSPEFQVRANIVKTTTTVYKVPAITRCRTVGVAIEAVPCLAYQTVLV